MFAYVREAKIKAKFDSLKNKMDAEKPCVLYILGAILVGFEGILLYVEQVDSVHGPTGSPRTESTCSELKFEWVETWMSHFLRSS